MKDESSRRPDLQEPAGELPSSDELARLKRLLLGLEMEKLRILEQRLDDPSQRANEVSAALTEAVVLRSSRDKTLTRALRPTVEEILHDSVEKDPQALAGSLFPVMGPAIRRSISEALRGMIQSLNESLRHSLSWQGFKWRLEARRTGKSFAEVVLAHTLVYRVEQAFLIHAETGLVLLHATAEAVDHQDADMVSAMLTAIQDFVRDSFHTDQNENLETMRVGELTLIIEQGPRAILAGAVRGTPPPELQTRFRETLELIHMEKYAELAEFEGDAQPFEAVRHRLEDCLEKRFQSRKKRGFPYFLAMLALLLSGLGYVAYLQIDRSARWNGYLDALAGEKGILVTSSRRGWSSYEAAGLRDPLAADPLDLLAPNGLDPTSVRLRFKPFQAQEPEFQFQRARDSLDPPESVELAFTNGVISASGRAPHQWIERARLTATILQGVASFRDDDLVAIEEEEFREIAQRVESLKFLFEFRQISLVPGQEKKISRLAADLRRLKSLGRLLERDFSITVTGHTDRLGREAANRRLSLNRAEAIAGILRENGLGGLVSETSGAGADRPVTLGETEEERQKNRRAELQLVFEPRASRERF
jgi:OOP family OmpA-OmpF porin